MNNTTKTVQQAADQHIQTALNGWLTAVANAAKTPIQSMKKFWIAHGWTDLEKADAETDRVSKFNDKLDDCHSCIAPGEFTGDDDETIVAAIAHFKALSAECDQYANDLQAILNRRF